MLNDRDDKYEEHEDSEYHFSDDEANFEVEPPEPKKPSPNKEGLLNRLTRSKRMLFSIVIFLVLVFTVYKMVAPTSTETPNTTIAAAPAVIQAPISAAAPVGPTSPNTAPGVMAVNPPVATPPPQQTVTQTTTLTPPVQSMPQQQVQAVQQPIQQQPTVPVQVQTPVPANAAATTTTTVVTQPATPLGSVQDNTTTTIQQTQAPVQQTVTDTTTGLSTESERLVNQMQNEYTQRMNDYAAQNKALQDQVQTLNARVAGMETQLNQLVQALTRQQNAPTEAAPAAPVREAETHSSYSVQAIIPGRAWLRSDNGETVTVAEGDVIRDLGRITKIDPYDGIVEINTGNKTISLSYGNGA